MPDTISAAPSEADLEKFCDAFDWDGWTDQKAAQRAFARAALAKWGKTSPPAVVEPLTQAQVIEAFCALPHQVQFVTAFDQGVRFAERHHGIKNGGSNGN